MSMDYFLSVYLQMLVLATLTIVGWYLITRGEFEVQPDNSIKKSGNIFKGFFFFFTKERPNKKRIYFSGRQLELLYGNELKNNFKGDSYLGSTDGAATDTVIFVPSKEMDAEFAGWEIQKVKLEEAFNIKFEELENSDTGILAKVYAEFPNYVFPEWVRVPVAECPTCMSSVYGSIIYWSWLAITSADLFWWSNTPILASILFWIAFCFSLSVLNTFIAKKVKK